MWSVQHNIVEFFSIGQIVLVQEKEKQSWEFLGELRSYEELPIISNPCGLLCWFMSHSPLNQVSFSPQCHTCCFFL